MSMALLSKLAMRIGSYISDCEMAILQLHFPFAHRLVLVCSINLPSRSASRKNIF
jgi:hypothetical protein